MDGEIDWKARAERAEKACAEMRKLLVGAIPSMKCTPFLSQAEKWMQEKTHALSSDCGSGYVRREELDLLERDNRRLRVDNARLREALEELLRWNSGPEYIDSSRALKWLGEVVEKAKQALAGKEGE